MGAKLRINSETAKTSFIIIFSDYHKKKMSKLCFYDFFFYFCPEIEHFMSNINK